MNEMPFHDFVHRLRGEIQVAMGGAELAQAKTESEAVHALLDTTLRSLEGIAELLTDAAENDRIILA